MRYAVRTTDGLRVVNTIPVGVRYKGKEYNNVFIKGDGTLLASTEDETITIKLPCICHDIKDEMLPEGAEIIWPDLFKDVINKWVDSEKYISHVEIQPEDVPTDRTYRNAWDHVDGEFTHDMDKAREIHKNKLRELRAPLLQELDTEYMKALEMGLSGATKAREVITQKETLRDITDDPRIEAATTIEELKAVTIEEV